MIRTLKTGFLLIPLFIFAINQPQNNTEDDRWFYVFSTCVDEIPGADGTHKLFFISELFYLNEYDYDDVEGAFFDQMEIDYDWAVKCWRADFEYRFEDRREGINHRRDKVASYKGEDYKIYQINLYN